MFTPERGSLGPAKIAIYVWAWTAWYPIVGAVNSPYIFDAGGQRRNRRKRGLVSATAATKKKRPTEVGRVMKKHGIDTRLGKVG